MSSTRQVLAAIPCYNERLAIGSVALLAREHVDEVLVIDDGSSDGTAAVATAAGATVIRHEQNGTRARAQRLSPHCTMPRLRLSKNL